jgi:hypothetical protein
MEAPEQQHKRTRFCGEADSTSAAGWIPRLRASVLAYGPVRQPITELIWRISSASEAIDQALVNRSILKEQVDRAQLVAGMLAATCATAKRDQMTVTWRRR